ncbi:tubulin-folding cofactor D [Raphidocelis subcapitata]|uniref:Tubulin-folding cofactor D n=1 Tax=Raphidocelis subcapitata TaxID=307507 RepID=A0A2V0NTT1_9CHLO|nr:tubulin-folding cofactor D [Raphidocelis subcapitata]|eukprot:GBF90082.1 tubulin-folding cofactor D [Raphidocelis subcapitata]
MEEPAEDSLLELEEAAELQEIVSRVVSSRGRDAGAVLPRYKQILTKYQEQPQLLDGSLEAIVQPLAALLRDDAPCGPHAAGPCGAPDAAAPDAAAAAAAACAVCRLLHVLVSVRGRKVVVRFFPHEAADLERALQVLLAVRAHAEAAATRGAAAGAAPALGGAAAAAAEEGALAAWEAQGVLLLWLSILILTPFDLATVDSAVGADACAGSSGGVTPLAVRIIELCQGYLEHPGGTREMAALLLARLLTRPDMRPALLRFLDWQEAALAAAAPRTLQFLLPGVLQTLALSFKLGRRPALLPHAPRVWAQLGALWDAAEASEAGGAAAAGVGAGAGAAGACLAGSSLARRLAIKLASRVGLTLLPPRLARWRYVRQRATLLGGAGGCDGPGAAPPPPGAEAAAAEAEAEADAAADAAAAAALEAGVEDLIGCLLAGLRDRDTGVRWAAAKGVARLTGCLPAELGAEVIDSVMELFRPSESDTAWHGGCLALAELARRSLLLPARLPAVAPVVAAALAYDVRRGPHSVGAHVRDAAAYVCWAFARAYEPALLGGSFLGLAGPLLTAAVYDREVHVRRAAASAFQEAVGRLGGALPHGLDLLGAVDCFTVAAFPDHRATLLGHLVSAKLRHWDKPTRALAARALAALAPAAGAPWVAGRALPALLARVTDDALEARAGAVLGIAELLPALASAGLADLDAASPGDAAGDAGGALSERVAGVLCVLAGRQLYRGKGGELMREAAARLVDCTAQAVSGLRRCGGGGDCGGSGGGSRVESPAGGDGGECGGDAAPEGAAGGPRDGAAAAEAPAAAAAAAPQLRDAGGPRLALPLGPAYHSAALALLEDCLTHTLGTIRAAGAAALASHARAHCGDGAVAGALRALEARCLARLADPNVAHRRGAAEALGSLPARLLLQPPPGRAPAVVGALCAASDARALPAEERDVEARVAAVEAMGRLATELASDPGWGASASAPGLGASASDPGLGASAPGLAALPQPASSLAEEGAAPGDGGCCAGAAAGGLISRAIAPALLAALHDYTTDNRGDVGSWVRGAAAEALVAVVPLALAEEEAAAAAVEAGAADVADGGRSQPQLAGAAAAKQQQQAQQQQWRAGRQRDAGRQLLEQPGTRAPPSPLAAVAVGELLRLGVERIARLREAAVAHARALLAQPAVRAAVPDADRVEAALPTDAADAAGVASLAAIGGLSALLDAPAYTAPLLEGLVASIGGVDASLSKAASGALISALEADDDAAAGGAAVGAGLRARLPAALVALWERERACGSSRLSLPLMRTAHLFITAGGLADAPVPAGAAAGDAPPAPAPFASRALALARSELRACGDVPRLLEGASLLAALAGARAASYAALQSCLALLVGRYPRVRRSMAEQLYLSLLAAEADEESGSEAGGDADAVVAETGRGGCAAAASGVVVGEDGCGAAPPPGWKLPRGEEGLEGAMDLLLASPWDGPLDGARAARGALAAALRVEVRARAAGAGGADAAAVAAKRAAAAAAAAEGRDEYLSYQSLLDDAARGGGY